MAIGQQLTNILHKKWMTTHGKKILTDFDIMIFFFGIALVINV